MWKKTFLLVVGLAGTVSVGAGEPTSPTPGPRDGPPPLTVTATPQPVPPLLKVPAGLKPAVIATPYLKKPSPWQSMTGIGLGIPLSPRLKNAYGTAFVLDLGEGYRVSSRLSLWLDVALALYGSKNDSLTGGNNFTLINAALWVRYRPLDSDLSPYVFAGPGLAYNENRSNSAEIYDPDTDTSYIPINAYEVDLLAEGGAGLDLRMGDGASVFFQTKLSYDFTSGHFAGFAFTDSPLVAMPVEVGVIFGM